MIRGGWMPGGRKRNMVWETAVTCALAVSRRAFGCRKILTIDWPFTVVDSMCSMLSTVVVRIRSYWVRSEEHTSELQSRLHLVCRLLLEKKKKIKQKSLSYLTDMSATLIVRLYTAGVRSRFM